MEKFSLISAVNNEAVLKSCLLKSPDVEEMELILQSGYASAARAYNEGMGKARHPWLIFTHQDVYLPAGWLKSVEKALEILSTQDPNWGVLGLWGATKSNGRAGFLYWTGVQGVAGQPFKGGIEVGTLDELLLIVRKSSGLRFDEQMPGFHMYGADICMEARRCGMKNYVISAFCIHNTNQYKLLPWQFWKCYLFMRKKWKAELPIYTTCTEITFWCWPVIRWNLSRLYRIARGRYEGVTRVADPVPLYQELRSRNLT